MQTEMRSSLQQRKNYPKKILRLIDNYLVSRFRNRPSTALFWYLPEPPVPDAVKLIQTVKAVKTPTPPYFIDYREKLRYPLENSDGIIVLPYDPPTGQQINPEAAFQYALGLHTAFIHTQQKTFRERFFHYADFFLARQTTVGHWNYDFDWFASKAPWSSALAQARGASVMMRAWLLTQTEKYRLAALKAFSRFTVPVTQGGFLQSFPSENCDYFEEYPQTPTGVINGFMAALISLAEVAYWLQDNDLHHLWQTGIHSLEKMLPWYSNGWWSVYDRDPQSPMINVNSPRYHLLEIHYLQILGSLTQSAIIAEILRQRRAQYARPDLRLRALIHKFTRKVVYR